MLVLALDTSTPACAVALCEVIEGSTDGRVEVLEAAAPVDARRSGELLAPTIQAVLAGARVRPADLGAVAVGLGPGPFTSLRVGIVTAASLGDALGVPVHGVCSLDALAVGSGGMVGVVTDARRKELYWAVHQDGVRTGGPAVGRPQQVAEVLAAAAVDEVRGTGAALWPDVFAGLRVAAPAYPTGLGIARVALPLLGSAPDPLEPLYLRRPDAAEPRRPKIATKVVTA